MVEDRELSLFDGTVRKILAPLNMVLTTSEGVVMALQHASSHQEAYIRAAMGLMHPYTLSAVYRGGIRHSGQQTFCAEDAVRQDVTSHSPCFVAAQNASTVAGAAGVTVVCSGSHSQG